MDPVALHVKHLRAHFRGKHSTDSHSDNVPPTGVTEALRRIAKADGAITVERWGTCGGESCIIGEFDARRYAMSVQDGSRGTVALKDALTSSFATVTHLLTLRGGALVLQQTYDYNDERQDSYEEFTLQRR